MIADQSRRKAIMDAALNLAEELDVARIEFLRSVIRSAGRHAQQGVRPPLMSRYSAALRIAQDRGGGA